MHLERITFWLLVITYAFLPFKVTQGHRLSSDVNKDLTFKAKAKAKDLTFKAKAKAKESTLKGKAKDLTAFTVEYFIRLLRLYTFSVIHFKKYA